MTAPAITVGIPFRDEERHLAGAIRSILGQTCEDLELVLVDDGSRDRSLEIARSFTDARIRVVSDGERRGLPARLNQIVDLARADLVARMDADDASHPSRLERQLAYLREHAACDVVGTWIALVDDDDLPFAVTEAAELPPRADVALVRGVMAHATILARRRWHLANRYDEALTRAEDRDLWVRTARATRFGIVAEPLYVVRVESRHPRFVRDYAESQSQNRRIYLRHGPELLGLRRTALACAATYGKTALVRAADVLGVTSRLVRRRGRPPTPAELARIEEALATAAQRA